MSVSSRPWSSFTDPSSYFWQSLLLLILLADDFVGFVSEDEILVGLTFGLALAFGQLDASALSGSGGAQESAGVLSPTTVLSPRLEASRRLFAASSSSMS
jgi:hypothetical protein